MEQNFNSKKSPIANGSQMPPPHAEKTGTGPLAGAFVIVVLIVAGGLYFWGTKMNQNSLQEVPYIIGDETASQGEITSDSASGLPPQSASDELSSIEADLRAMNLEQFEAQIETDIGQIE